MQICWQQDRRSLLSEALNLSVHGCHGTNHLSPEQKDKTSKKASKKKKERDDSKSATCKTWRNRQQFFCKGFIAGICDNLLESLLWVFTFFVLYGSIFQIHQTLSCKSDQESCTRLTQARARERAPYWLAQPQKDNRVTGVTMAYDSHKKKRLNTFDHFLPATLGHTLWRARHKA